jgi:chlorite dismutase
MLTNEAGNVVAHCRTAIELLTELGPLNPTPGARPPTFRQKIEHLFATIDGSLTAEHRQRLPEIINALWGLTSRAVHPHKSGAFTRADADFILLTTGATLAYIGKLIERGQAT